MNYRPFVGFGFYGATSDAERASFYCSWGLLAIAPISSTGYVNIYTFILRRRRR